MEYILENRETYLYVKITGMEALNASVWNSIKSTRLEILALANKTGIFKLLMDCREVSFRISAIDRFFFASFFVEQNIKRIFNRQPIMKIVLLLNTAMLDPEKFGEKVARNRGLYLFVTDDMDKGLEWLDVQSLVKA